MIFIKSDRELEYMRESGKIVAHTHEVLLDRIKPGISTKELDRIAEDTIRKYGAEPSFKGYGGFPASICASINEVVVHGIPDERVLKEGDIISIDIGALKNGYHGDAARTHPVGEVSQLATDLMEATKRSFYEGIKFARVGFRLSDVSHAIQSHVESKGFSIVRDYVGHGIGQKLHEDPQIPNFGKPGKGPRLMKGMVLAIEPMVNQGGHEVKTLTDMWTVVTIDKSLSAHFEHTIAITDDEPLIFTQVD